MNRFDCIYLFYGEALLIFFGLKIILSLSYKADSAGVKIKIARPGVCKLSVFQEIYCHYAKILAFINNIESLKIKNV